MEELAGKQGGLVGKGRNFDRIRRITIKLKGSPLSSSLEMK